MTHGWNVAPKEAVEIQQKLREKVVLSPLKKKISFIAGADVSMNLFSNTLYAGIVVFTFPELVKVEHALVKTETQFPYIPGLLSFREIPALLQCFEKLQTKPDLIVVDGQGIAHPRRLGIASHLGVLLDVPTVGCAKSVLTGTLGGKERRGGFEYREIVGGKVNRKGKSETIGAALYTKKNCKPIIVSPGHKVSLADSITTIQKTVRGYKLPEVIRQAHNVVNSFRKGEIV